VIGVCRRGSPELQETGARIEEAVDVTSDNDVHQLARRLQNAPIDVLINNAGILSDESVLDLDFDSMRRQFEVNSLAPLRVTTALLSCLNTGAKVAIITSRMGSIADNSSGGRYGYRMSKAAVNAAGVSLAHDLKPRGVAVALLHPGWVRTDMTSNQGLIDADESARGLLARLDELTLESSGSFWHTNGEILPW
jgi:NAD(P)-dependent dehydrogenase (short-subunit alcohol dehydrogenase family)